MNYYKRHIGDYAKKAGRLSMLEHGSYTLLLDACYDRERFPTEDEAIEWAWARTDEEINAVKFVLKRFFTLQDGVYVQNHVQEELEHYKQNAAKNAAIAAEREAKKRGSARTVHEPCSSVHESAGDVHERAPNHKPITNNQEPVKEQEQRAPDFAPSEDQPENVKAVLAMRAAGVFATKPSDPELLAAIAEGVTPEMLAEIAKDNQDKPQLWIVRAARGRLRDARAGPRASPNGASGSVAAVTQNDHSKSMAEVLRGQR